MVSFQLVDVSSIESKVSRSNFRDEEIETLAQAILDGKGLLKPVILKVTGVESYTVIDGDLEYYAAARAKERDSRNGEMVNAFVISSKDEKAVLHQVELLKRQVPREGANAVDQEVRSEAVSESSLERRLDNVENRFEARIEEIKKAQFQGQQRLEQEIEEIKNSVLKPTDPLDLFNESNRIPELVFRLKSAGMAEKAALTAANKINEERKNKLFESLMSVIERMKAKGVKGLNEKRVLAIVDGCFQVRFMNSR